MVSPLNKTVRDFSAPTWNARRLLDIPAGAGSRQVDIHWECKQKYWLRVQTLRGKIRSLNLESWTNEERLWTMLKTFPFLQEIMLWLKELVFKEWRRSGPSRRGGKWYSCKISTQTTFWEHLSPQAKTVTGRYNIQGKGRSYSLHANQKVAAS